MANTVRTSALTVEGTTISKNFSMNAKRRDDPGYQQGANQDYAHATLIVVVENSPCGLSFHLKMRVASCPGSALLEVRVHKKILLY